LMNKPISNIIESNGLISFVACHPGVEPPTFKSPAAGTTDGFTISWNAVPEATSYEIELVEIPAATKDTAEAKRFETDFSMCYSKTTGFSDIGSKLNSYGFPTSWKGTKLYTSPNGLKVGTTSATGSFYSPWYLTPESGEITIVLGTSSESTTGSLTLYDAEVENGSIIQSSIEDHKIDFEFTEPGRMVFNLKTLKGAYYHEIAFDKVTYLNYLAIYYGTFSAKELGIDNPTGRVKAARRRAKTTTLTTQETNYTFTGLTKTSTYQYKVRGIGPEATSGWSDTQTFKFDATGINTINTDNEGTVQYYDLQGRKVETPTRGLLIRKQGNKVKKIMVR